MASSPFEEFRDYVDFSVRVDRFFNVVNIYAMHRSGIKACYAALPSYEQVQAVLDDSDTDADVKSFLLITASTLSYMAATGIFSDSVDHVKGDVSNDMLPPVMHALKQITHRHGLFICIGNHDQIDSRQEFVRHVRRYFPLFINQRRSLDIDGERITIAGLDYAGGRPVSPRTGHLANVAATLYDHSLRRDGPVIALSRSRRRAGRPAVRQGHWSGSPRSGSKPCRERDRSRCR